MRVDFLEMVNFRNMRSEKISFEKKKFVALIGENGSGKTTILEAITKAFVPVLRAVNGDAVKQCDLNNNDIREGSSSVAVTAGIELDGDKYIWTSKRRRSSVVPFDEMIEEKERLGNDLKKLKQKYIECVTQGTLPLVLYYGTDRIIREVPRRGHIKNFEVTDALRYCFDNINYFRDFYDWFKTEEDIELRGLRDDKNYKNPRLDCVRTAIELMIKGCSNLRIELNPSRMLMTNEEGIDLQIDQMSGGYKAVLSVVADIAKRLSIANPYSKNPLGEEAVILIDELDLHLHPKWQKTIVGDLKRTFPNCQFIITTHSPFIIQALSADELFDISQMQYAVENGNYNGWSIDVIQEQKMGVEKKTSVYHEIITDFSDAVDREEYALAKELYEKLLKMVHPDSHERKIIDLDMEMIDANDKTQ
ncbi:MAG: AAA family ATPase [bacterium]|nr:AAA family ATPase [bacterium]MDY4100704.1 AAA family ATPase [Lachnospiraceae bacterium]